MKQEITIIIKGDVAKDNYTILSQKIPTEAKLLILKDCLDYVKPNDIIINTKQITQSPQEQIQQGLSEQLI